MAYRSPSERCARKKEQSENGSRSHGSENSHLRRARFCAHPSSGKPPRIHSIRRQIVTFIHWQTCLILDIFAACSESQLSAFAILSSRVLSNYSRCIPQKAPLRKYMGTETPEVTRQVRHFVVRHLTISANLSSVGKWIAVFVALVQCLRSGESKVGWLSKSHPKNLIHKVLRLQTTGIDVSPRRINLGTKRISSW